MGAGAHPAGLGPAGANPFAEAPLPRNVSLPTAILFDGQSGDYLLDANGRYQSLHPVSQRVALKLLVKFGAIASSPKTGAAFSVIKRGTPAQREAQARQIVNDTLKADIAAGDIRLVRTDVDTSNRYATLVAVYFVNLRENLNPNVDPQKITIRTS